MTTPTIEQVMTSEDTKLYFLSPNVVAVFLDAIVDGEVRNVRVERAWHGVPMSWSIAGRPAPRS